MKLAVQAAKRMADRRLGERFGNDFEGNKKMFWKEVKRVRKGEQAREEMVKDVNGQILRDGVEVRRRLAVSRSRTMHLQSPPLTINRTVLKESDDLDILGVTFDSKLTFEKHLRSVSRAASQRLGYLEELLAGIP